MSLSDESDWDNEEDEFIYDDWPDHSKPYVHRVQNRFDAAATVLEIMLRRATTTQLGRIDAVVAALAAKRAELQPQARPRPPARPPAWGAVGPISDPLKALSRCVTRRRAGPPPRPAAAGAPRRRRRPGRCAWRWTRRTGSPAGSWPAPCARLRANRCAL